MFFGAFKENLNALKYGMADAERRFINGEYTAKALIEIIEHRVKVGSAPMINQNKLFGKYVQDLCLRLSIDLSALIQVYDAIHGTGNESSSAHQLRSYEKQKLFNKRYIDLIG